LAIGIAGHSADRPVRAKLRDVSNTERSAIPIWQPLITYAIACVVLDEIEEQGIKIGKVAERSGVPARSLSDYLAGKTAGVSMEKWSAIASALGLKGSEVLARAEDRLSSMPDVDIELLLGVGGQAAVMVLRDKGKHTLRNQRAQGDRSEDPPDASNGRHSRSA
jgi:transcriptional regulator with XRE-family HTH domain